MASLKSLIDWVKGEDMEDEINDFTPIQKASTEEPVSYSTESASKSGKVVKMANTANLNVTANLAVVLVKPDRFECAAETADYLKDKRAVVLNLEQTNKDVARRLVDFLSGVAYANEGKIKRIANSTYLITPYNVDILGDIIDELESSGMYI